MMPEPTRLKGKHRRRWNALFESINHLCKESLPSGIRTRLKHVTVNFTPDIADFGWHRFVSTDSVMLQAEPTPSKSYMHFPESHISIEACVDDNAPNSSSSPFACIARQKTAIQQDCDDKGGICENPETKVPLKDKLCVFLSKVMKRKLESSPQRLEFIQWVN